MTKKTPTQPLDAHFDQTDGPELRTVEYYRKRYSELFVRFSSFKELVNEIAAAEPELNNYDGYVLLIGVHNKRRGLETTARIVNLMEQLRPEEPKPKASRLSRQKLSKPSTRLLLLGGLLTFLSCTSNHQPRTTGADSVYVSAWIGPAKIAVSVKLPADDLDSYRVGQTLPCSPYSSDPDRFSNVFVEDEAGTFPVVIKSLTPIQ